MFILRLPSAIILVSLILAGIYASGITGKIIFTSMAMMFAFLAVFEFLDIISKIGRISYMFTASFFGAMLVLMLVVMSPHVHDMLGFEMKFVAIFMMLLWMVILFSKSREDLLAKVINSISGFILVAVPLSFMVVIYMIEDGKGGDGRKLLLYLLAVTKAGDIGAYVAGVSSSKIMSGGNHKIVPSISPKKSWEGTMGGLILSIVAAVFLVKILPVPYRIGEFAAVMMGTALFIGGFLGDLSESSLKRIAGIKDSGKIVPGIGGILDLLDSLLLNAPLFYIFLIPMMR